MPPSEAEQLRMVICRRALSDFLKENPEFEIMSSPMPFDSYTLVDAKKLSNHEVFENRYLIYLHGEYEGTQEWCYEFLLNSMIESGAIAKLENFDPKYPKIKNLFQSSKNNLNRCDNGRWA